MQVVVKMPHTDIITITGKSIPEDIIKYLKRKGTITITDNGETDIASETEWYKKTKSLMKPGDYLRIYREREGLTLEQLGEKLGGVPRQNISGMEKGRRAISKETAVKLAEIFDVDYKNFL